MYTLQEMYDKQRKYFSRPGAVLAKAAPLGEACSYRDENGNACAVGCLIPDNAYDPSFENAGIAGLYPNSELQALFGDEGVFYGYLQETQDAHDNAKDVPAFLLELDRIAMDYGLEVAGI
jgi:hypothetical protein